jgi:putative CocE/NonD family hydrolase
MQVKLSTTTSQKIPGFDVVVERDAICELRDGTILRSDIYRPEAVGTYPVLLARGPYDKRVALSSFGNSHAAWFAEHGYIVIIQDTRGRYASEGIFYPFANEAEDGFDSVEWAAKVSGSDGQVGMFGFSYLGATQLLAAVLKPPSLKAIVPAFTASQFYDGWTYNGGAFALAFNCYWANLLSIETAGRAGDMEAMEELVASLGSANNWFWSVPLKEYPPLKNKYAPYFFDWLEHPTYDDYWRRWSIDENYSQIDVPALHIGGWYDIFLSGTVKNFCGVSRDGSSEKTRNSQKLLIGPWTHMPWSPVGNTGKTEPSTSVIDDWTLQWFDEFLKDKRTGILENPVTLYPVNGERRDYSSWPDGDVNVEEWFLHSDGRANSKFGDGRLDKKQPSNEHVDLFVSDPAIPIQSNGGHSCCFDAITPMGPADQHTSESSRMVLVYTSEPFDKETLIVGNASLTLFATSSALETDFAARLCEVSLDGVSTNIQEGIIRSKYQNSLEHPKSIEPDVIHEYTIRLGPVGYLLAKGSQLRVTVAGSDFPQWDRNTQSGNHNFDERMSQFQPATQVVFHDETRQSRLQISCLDSSVRFKK